MSSFQQTCTINFKNVIARHETIVFISTLGTENYKKYRNMRTKMYNSVVDEALAKQLASTFLVPKIF